MPSYRAVLDTEDGEQTISVYAPNSTAAMDFINAKHLPHYGGRVVSLVDWAELDALVEDEDDDEPKSGRQTLGGY